MHACTILFKKFACTRIVLAHIMGKFSLQKAVAAGKVQEKRPLEEVAQQQPATRSKILKASEVVVEEDGPKPPKSNSRKLSANAPVEVIIQKYSDSAGDIWEAFRTEKDQPLFQCQIKQDVARSVCYQFRDKFADFLRVTEGVPNTLAELQDTCGIRLLIGDKNDPAASLLY